MLVMVVLVLTINILLAKPPIDSLLFALALAVGLAPELLPAIISITLAHGSQQMAKRGVIVRRLNAIENFGSMDVLRTDKTGTLTEGVVRLDGALDPDGQPSTTVLDYTYLNSQYQTGINNLWC
jgi:Mg2+-importing ATPase